MTKMRCLLPVVFGMAIGGAVPPARADVVTTWNETAIEVAARDGQTGAVHPARPSDDACRNV